ncbi:hypothetical protein GCM10012287_40820 [Streptomyces daqingensis]|uniref:Transposase n=1 Tax=Streptomyces daqingensis TaxID=1472640 RepID=A0ABQ2MK16_9ACTN|nr:hypothetical protein GCM10012287_40820 [Streptomyces daqingensis]
MIAAGRRRGYELTVTAPLGAEAATHRRLALVGAHLTVQKAYTSDNSRYGYRQ